MSSEHWAAPSDSRERHSSFFSYLRWDVAAMAGDLLGAAAARSGTLGMRHAPGELLAEAVAHVMPLGILAYGAASVSGSRRQLWRYLLVAVLVVVTDTLLLITNAQPLSYPLAATCGILLLFPLEPALRSASTADIQRKAGLFVIMAGHPGGSDRAGAGGRLGARVGGGGREF